MLNRDDSSKDGDAGDSCYSSSNWRRLRSSRADHHSTWLTECSAVLDTAVESSPAMCSAQIRFPAVESWSIDIWWSGYAKLAYDYCLSETNKIGGAHL